MSPPAPSTADPGGSAASRCAGSLQRHPMDPSIRLTLISLYLALVLPLPWLAPSPLRPTLLLAVVLGLVLVLALSSETVELDDAGIRVGYPPWCRWWLRRGWSLPWSRVKGLTPVATSQAGRVYYIRTSTDSPGTQPEAWLLPQRVAGFDRFLERFSRMSGISTTSVVRLSPPRTYRLLALLSLLMLAAEIGIGLWRGLPQL